MKDRGVIVVILCSLVVLLTIIDVSMYAANRILIKNHQQQLLQINQQIVQRDRAVQQLIGQLKATKTIGEVQKILEKVQ